MFLCFIKRVKYRILQNTFVISQKETTSLKNKMVEPAEPVYMSGLRLGQIVVVINCAAEKNPHVVLH